MVECSNCGSDVGESKFCPNCGNKIEIQIKSFCQNCGQEVGDSKFCPNCGNKIEKDDEKVFCPNCGEETDLNSKFCPHCGFSNSKDQTQGENDFIDNVMDFDDKISGKLNGLFTKSKTMDAVLDKTSVLNSYRYKIYQNREYLESIEPVFLEVYDSVEDEFVKDILMLERGAMSTTSSVIGIVASQIYTPTKDMPHDEAVKFYQDMVDDIVGEINHEKQKGTFDEETFYKKKVKQATLDNASVLGISKSMKAFKKNRD